MSSGLPCEAKTIVSCREEGEPRASTREKGRVAASMAHPKDQYSKCYGKDNGIVWSAVVAPA